MLKTRQNTQEIVAASSKDSNVIALHGKVEPIAPVKERRHATFFDVINASLAINSPAQFCAWAQGDLQKIFPHGMLAGAIVLIEKPSGRVQQLIACNLPKEYVHDLHETGGLIDSPIFTQWIKTRRPVLFEPAGQQGDSAWLTNLLHFGLKNLAAHGQCDIHSRTTSYFTFCNMPGELTPRHAELLDMLVPHLHTAFVRALVGAKKKKIVARAQLPDLSMREREILQWLGTGKTNWEIAQVLHISENTVKNHVQHILIKLKANSRAEAVAKGLFPG